MQHHWLVKSEPEAFSWQDLARAPKQTTCWDGVRNYQARNYLRDQMQPGDAVCFYQSRAKTLGIVGTMVVVRAGYPDPTQFDPHHAGYDPNSRREAPRWYAVDVQLLQRFARVATLAELKNMPALAGAQLLQKGSRLSVQPLTPAAYRAILRTFGKKGISLAK